MHFSSVDTYVTGTGECAGFKASFGCYSGTDAVTIGDALTSPLGLDLGCTGSADDECRKCSLWHVFDLLNPALLPEGQWFNYGDESLDRVSASKVLSICASIALLLLFIIIVIKEIIGLYITIFMVWEFKTKKGTYFDRDHDVITVGKDSIVALLYFFGLCIKIYCEEGLAGIALYQERFKLLEDGWTSEELMAKWERDHYEMAESVSSQEKEQYEKAFEEAEEGNWVLRGSVTESVYSDNEGESEINTGIKTSSVVLDQDTLADDSNYEDEICGNEEIADEEEKGDIFNFHSPITSGAFQDELRRLYEINCPEKASTGNINQVVATFKGREYDLLSSIGAKYKLAVKLDGVIISTTCIRAKSAVTSQKFIKKSTETSQMQRAPHAGMSDRTMKGRTKPNKTKYGAMVRSDKEQKVPLG